MNEAQRRRAFQKIKSFNNAKFWDWMNVMHTRAYAKAEQHYQEAMDIVLQPKQKAAVIAKATEIREEWDGMATVTLSETEGTELRSLGV